MNYPRSIAGVKVAVLLRDERGGTVKASLRGKGDVPVNRIAHRFGGGGHENAAGCTLPGHARRRPRATLLAAVREALARAAGDSLSDPADALRHPAGRQGRRASPRSRSWRICAACSARRKHRSRRHARSRRHRACCPSWSARRPSSRRTSWTSTRSTWRRVRLGVTTDTQDLSGAVLETRPVPALDAPRASRPRSAPSSGASSRCRRCTRRSTTRGRRLYELARAGRRGGARAARGDRPLDRARSRSRCPDFVIRVRCGKGTYVRTLAADLGAALGLRRRRWRGSCAPAWARTRSRTRVSWDDVREARDGERALAARSCRPTPRSAALARGAARRGRGPRLRRTGRR